MLNTEDHQLLRETHDACIRLETLLVGPDQSSGLMADVRLLQREHAKERGFRKATLAVCAFVAFAVEPLVIWLTSRKP